MERPFPPELGEVLRPVLPDLAQSIIAAIAREVPEYARPLEGPFGRGIRAGTEAALARFVDELGGPRTADRAARQVYVELGRGEARAGRQLDQLLSAYRLGARLAWERFVAVADAAGQEPHTLYRLASAMFSYIDAISAESVEGYAQEQFRVAGERARRRRALARVLALPDTSMDEVRAAALHADWALPATLGVVLAAAPGIERRLARLDQDALSVVEGETAVVYLPDPSGTGRVARLAKALEGVEAILGPEVPVERAHVSLGRAGALRELVAAGRVAGAGILRADEHLLDLLLHGADAGLRADLASDALAPLAGLGENPRARARETLRAWLDHPGQVQRIAGVLHVHPQTVRYRVKALRELFGDRLDDPDERLRLGVALRLSSPVDVHE